VDLVGPQTGKFVSEPTTFPKCIPINKPGAISIPPAKAFPMNFFQLYNDVSIMEQFVVKTNISGESCFIPKSK